MTSYTYQEHQLSAAEKLWLAEVNKATIKVDRRVVKVRLLGKVPDDFDPDKIDQRLCREGKLTLIGLWHVDRANALFNAMHTTIGAIRALIIKKPGIVNEVSTSELSKLTGLDEGLLAKSLRALDDLGNFHSGGAYSPDGLGFLKITLTGDYSYDEYLAYKSLDDLMERFYINRDPARARSFPLVTAQSMVLGGTLSAFSQADQIAVKPKTAFVLMAMDPAKPELEDVYMTIKDICSDFGITAYRADEIQHQDRITDRILQEIETCEYVIADLSYERPNVYYEVGFAHAKNKKPILYRARGTQLHFDLLVHNVPEYKNVTELRDLLRKRFSAILGRDPRPSADKSQPK